MPMTYPFAAIPDSVIPRAGAPILRHALATYASEINKVASVWRAFSPDELSYRPHPRSSAVLEILSHELLSSRRFFAEFLGVPEPPATQVLPADTTPEAFIARLRDLALARLSFLARQDEPWWLAVVPFFDVERERIWIFWRRVLHTAHHRTQLAVYLRLMNKAVPPIYGPTADATWRGADPTRSVDAASRK